jgi:hypothetical protein
MDEGTALRELLTPFLGDGGRDEAALRAWLADIPPALWPAFSAEAAAELTGQDAATSGAEAARQASARLKRRLLGEERTRREYGQG